VKGRLIERSEFTPYIDQNKRNIEARPELYKQRQSIVEHPYGTIKRQWGAKAGIIRCWLMFTACNLRRLMNIIDKNTFRKFLQELVFLIYEICATTKPIIVKISHLFFLHRYCKLLFSPIRIPLKFELYLKSDEGS
jgi:hypothetical protein